MVAGEALGRLVCGAADYGSGKDDFSRMMASVHSQIVDYSEFSVAFQNRAKDKDASYFLPLALRSIMEATCSGILARIDPFRVVYAAKAQLSTSYEKSAPQAASLKWNGDMVIAEKRKQAAPVQVQIKPKSDDISKQSLNADWDPNLGREKLPRAIFSLHMYEVLWGPAHKAFIDWAVQLGSTSSIISELAELPSEQMRDLFSVKGSQLYSELSKGIHPEFLIDRRSEFDEMTLVELSEKVTKWVVQLALLSHFGVLCNGRLDRTNILELVNVVEQTFE